MNFHTVSSLQRTNYLIMSNFSASEESEYESANEQSFDTSFTPKSNYLDVKNVDSVNESFGISSITDVLANMQIKSGVKPSEKPLDEVPEEIVEESREKTPTPPDFNTKTDLGKAKI